MSAEENAPIVTTGAEEYIQATIGVEDLNLAGAQGEILRAVEGLPGVDSVRLVSGKLEICYDPLRVSEKELEAAIDHSGHHPLGGEAKRASLYSEP